MYRTARKMCLPFRKNVLTIYEQCAICAEKCECRLGKMLLPSTKICYTAQDKCADRPGKFYCHPGKICFSHKKCVLTLKKKCARKDVLSIHDKFSNRPGKMCLLSWNNVLTVQEKCALQCWWSVRASTLPGLPVSINLPSPSTVNPIKLEGVSRLLDLSYQFD